MEGTLCGLMVSVSAKHFVITEVATRPPTGWQNGAGAQAVLFPRPNKVIGLALLNRDFYTTVWVPYWLCGMPPAALRIYNQ